MAILRFSDLDLYALLDSDTDEARTFTTYLGYWVCLAEHIQEEHGDPPYEAILADLQVRRPFVRIGSRPKPSEVAAATMRALLLNGWTSELVGPPDQPLVVGLHRQHRDQPDQAGVVGEDPDDAGAPGDLAVEAVARQTRRVATPPGAGSVRGMASPKRPQTPLAALRRGVLAGVAGTAVMTAAQELSAKLQSSGGGGNGGQHQEPEDPWEQASTPAKVARRVIEGVFQKEASPDLIPALTHGMHWAYGTAWGAVYGLLADSADRHRPLRRGLAFGTAVWTMSYVQLVPMGLYEPPWTYGPKALATELGFHLAYGGGTGLAYRALEAR